MRAPPVAKEKRPMVLVIDDDPVQCMLVREALEHAGFNSDEANGGVQGLEKAGFKDWRRLNPCNPI